MKKLFAILLVCIAFSIQAQAPLDIKYLESLSSKKRLAYLQNYPFWKTEDLGEMAQTYFDLIEQLDELGDHKSKLFIKFTAALSSYHEEANKIHNKEPVEFFTEIHNEAKQIGYHEIEILGLFNLEFASQTSQDSLYIKQYAAVVKTFDKMQTHGFDKFENLYLEGHLYTMGKLLWELEDIETAFKYFSIAKQHLQEPSGKNALYYTLVLNHMRDDWNKKGETDRALEIAQELLDFHNKYDLENPHLTLWWNNFWKGFCNLEIAQYLLKKNQFEKAEQYADRGYELSTIQGNFHDTRGVVAEFDALQVLIPIKLELNKLNEVEDLLNRSFTFKGLLEDRQQFDYFKSLSLYQSASEYYFLRKDSENALKYLQLASEVKDSLSQRNDAKQYLQISHRIDAENYVKQINAIDDEKKRQQLYKIIFIVIAVLVFVLGVYNYIHFRLKRKQKEQQLAHATKELKVLMKSYKEKSLLVESLNEEKDKLQQQENKSQYLEQLVTATIITEEDWINFKNLFNKVYPNFIDELKADFNGLTKAEQRLLVLEKLELSPTEIANMLGVSKNTIYQTRKRLRAKKA